MSRNCEGCFKFGRKLLKYFFYSSQVKYHRKRLEHKRKITHYKAAFKRVNRNIQSFTLHYKYTILEEM